MRMAALQGAIVSLDGAVFGINPTTSDEKGKFRISGVPPGRYRVTANPAVKPFPAEIRTDGTSKVHYARKGTASDVHPQNGGSAGVVFGCFHNPGFAGGQEARNIHV